MYYTCDLPAVLCMGKLPSPPQHDLHVDTCTKGAKDNKLILVVSCTASSIVCLSLQCQCRMKCYQSLLASTDRETCEACLLSNGMAKVVLRDSMFSY